MDAEGEMLFFLLLLGREIWKLGARVYQGFAKLRKRDAPPVVDVAKLAGIIWAIADPESQAVVVPVATDTAAVSGADHPIFGHNFQCGGLATQSCRIVTCYPEKTTSV